MDEYIINKLAEFDKITKGGSELELKKFLKIFFDENKLVEIGCPTSTDRKYWDEISNNNYMLDAIYGCFFSSDSKKKLSNAIRSIELEDKALHDFLVGKLKDHGCDLSEPLGSVSGVVYTSSLPAHEKFVSQKCQIL